jgi:hypothetical protein
MPKLGSGYFSPFLSSVRTLRSIPARPSKLCSGVTCHFNTPHDGMLRTIWSASSLDDASRTNTNFRSPTGNPPAMILLSASSLRSASKVFPLLVMVKVRTMAPLATVTGTIRNCRLYVLAPRRRFESVLISALQPGALRSNTPFKVRRHGRDQPHGSGNAAIKIVTLPSCANFRTRGRQPSFRFPFAFVYSKM